MFGPTAFERWAFAVLVALGTTSASRSIGGQATAAPNGATNPSQPATRHLHYHISLAKRDTSSGAYIWTGRVEGAVTGGARMELRFPDRPPKIPGTLPLQTHWVVTASPASESFEANLTGAIDLASAKTHLVGTIVGGRWSGQSVETNSQVFHRAPNGTLSDSEGTITISPARPPD